MTKKRKLYEQLVTKYHAELYRFAYWLCKDQTVAEDLLQETFLRAWRALDNLIDEAAAKSWLITILRRENARRFERKQFDYDNDTECDELLATQQHDPEHNMAQRQLHRHISTLAPEYREPLLLQAIMGCSGDEIAEILKLNKNTVMTRLFRAKKQLKVQLNQDEHQIKEVK